MQAVLIRLGFKEHWVELIMRCVRIVRYLVVMNGETRGSIIFSHGLCLRDPLSLLLFLFCSEDFSTLLRVTYNDGPLTGIQASRGGGGPRVSHLFFANDTLIFGMTSTKGANNVVAILWEYERCSRQQVNFDKSLVYFSLNVSHGMRAIVGGVLGVHSTTDPENYIGLPMVVGSNKKRAFWAIKNLFLGKIGSWYNRCLSQGGKAVFIKSIL